MENPLEQQRKGYEDRTEKTARKFGINKEDIIESDARSEDQTGENTDLISEDLEGGVIRMKGGIDGKNVEIEAKLDPTGERWEFIRGTMDNKPLSEKEADKLIDKYYISADERLGRIHSLRREKMRNKLQQKKEKDIEELKDKIISKL